MQANSSPAHLQEAGDGAPGFASDDTPLFDLTAGVSIDLAESATAAPYRLTLKSDRGRQLLAEGYPRAVIPFILRLEGRENTLLDFTAARTLTEQEEGERRAIARTLDELKAITKGQGEPDALEPSPIRPTLEIDSDRPPALRRVPEAATTREALRRLLHVRCGQLEQTTGEDADETRHQVVNIASQLRTDSSREADEDELRAAVRIVEGRLEKAGFDFAAADAEYEQRRAQRERAFGDSRREVA